MKEELLDYKIALQIVLGKINCAKTEEVALADALGRILALDVIANRDLPRYNNSAMDGFAVRAEDADAEAVLKIVGEIAAGSQEALVVESGTAVRIMTGAIIPAGADAVIPVEQVELAGEQVKLLRQVEKGEHIRWQGEDLQQGSEALTAGMKLSAAEIGLLASLGCGSVMVSQRPKVAILATGDELVPPGQALGAAQIYDSNTAALCAAVATAGGEPVPLGIARDDSLSLKEKIAAGLNADVLITAAGASVGEFDLVRDVLSELESEEIFWGVAIKPGKPTGFSLCAGRPVFCLPGNPVSALVTFELFVRPALRKMTGQLPVIPQSIHLPLLEPMKKKKARALFARVRVVSGQDGLYVSSAGSQQTGIMTSMVHADGLAVLPDGQTEFAAGESIEVLLLRQN